MNLNVPATAAKLTRQSTFIHFRLQTVGVLEDHANRSKRHLLGTISSPYGRNASEDKQIKVTKFCEETRNQHT
jgi:hypothetical protein